MKKLAEICRKSSHMKTGVRRSLAIFGVLVVAILPAGQTYAQTIDPCIFDALKKDTVWFVGCGSGSTTGSSCIGGGTLDKNLVPEPLNGIATATGTKFNVPPALVVAIYYVENNGKQGADPSKYQYREPPPPYGNGGPWPVSSAGAKGPFQFLDGTWAGYAIDGNGDGKSDVLDLTDAAFGAAHYLQDLLKQAGGDIAKAAGGYEAGHPVDSEYGHDAFALYQYFSKGAGGSAGGGCLGGCTDPLRDVPNLGPGRIDQGVDYTGDGPVHAACSGTIVHASTSSGWPGGNFIAFQVSGGNADKLYIYVAENCTLNPSLKVGDPVTPDTVLCEMHNSYPFIEIGWGNGQGNALAADQVPSCYDINNSTSTAFGVNFSDFLKALGTPPGVLQPPPITCTLPSGFPTW